MIVIIVGAGIAGLTCSIALAQHQNIQVTILERAENLVKPSYGIEVPCNATRALRSLGILDTIIERAGRPATASLALDYRRGTQMLRRDFAKGESLYGSPYLLIHRADYLQTLYDEAVSRGVQVKFGCDVDDVDFDAPHLKLTTGEIHSADVIVGCDGIHSTIRSALYPSFRPCCTGLYAHRATLRRDQLTSRHFDKLLKPGICHSWLGPRFQIVFYPIRGGKEFDLLAVGSRSGLEDGLRQNDYLNYLRDRTRGWDTAVRELLNATEGVSSFPLLEMDDLPSWGSGRVVLIGDAVHPTLPHLSQGAAMCVEDGLMLGTLLGRFADHPSIGVPGIFGRLTPRILRSFENIRRRRTTDVTSQSRLASTYSQIPGNIAEGTPSTAFDLLGQRICSSIWPPANQAWIKELYCYNAEEVALSAFSQLAEHLLHELEHGDSWNDGNTQGVQTPTRKYCLPENRDCDRK